MNYNLRSTSFKKRTQSFMKSFAALICLVLLISGKSFAATYFSQGTGNFSTLLNWNTNPGGGGSSPVALDLTNGLHIFVVQDNHTVTLDQDVSLAGLTVQGGTFGGSLVIGNNVTARVITVTGSTSVTAPGNILVSSFDAIHTFNFRGDLSNTGTINLFNTSSSNANAIFNGSTISISGAGAYTFSNFTVTNTPVTPTTVNLNTNITATGTVNLTTATTLNNSGNTINVGGDWVVAGTGNMTGTGTVNFNSATAQQITNAASFNNITVNTPNLILTGATTVSGNFSVLGSSGVVASSTATHTFNGNFTVSPTASINHTNGTFLFNGTSSQNIDVENSTFNNMTFSNGGVISPKTLNGNLTLLRTLTINSGARVISAGTKTIGNSTSGTVSLRIDGIADFSGSTNFIGTQGASITTNQSAVDLGTTDINLNFTGAITLTFTFVAPATSVNYFVNNNIAANTGNITVSNNVTITGLPGFGIALANGCNMTIAGANNFPVGFTNFNFATNSTVTYNAAFAQVVRGGIVSYGNLALANNTKTLDDTLEIKRNLALSGTVNANLIGFKITIKGDVTSTAGCILANDETVFFNAPDANQTLSASATYNFNNVEFSLDAPSISRTKTISGNINVSGDFNATCIGGSVPNQLNIDLLANQINGGGSGSFNMSSYVRLLTTGLSSFRNSMLTFGARTLDPLSTIRYANATANTVQLVSNDVVYGNIEFVGSGVSTYNNKSLCGNTTVIGDINRIGGNIVLRDSIATQVNLAGNLYIRGIDYPNPNLACTWVFDGGVQNLGLGANSLNLPNAVFANSGTKFFSANAGSTVNIFGDLTINDNVVLDANNKNLNLRGNFIASGPGTSGQFLQLSSSTTTLSSITAPQNINFNTASSFGGLTINKPAVAPANRIVNLNDDIKCLGALILTANAADLNAAGRTVRVGGSVTLNTGTNVTASTSTFVLDGTSGAQTFTNTPGVVLNNLICEGTASKAIASATTFNGDVTIDNTALSGGTVALNVLGHWNVINSGTFSQTGAGSVTFNGVNQNISASNFNNIIFANSGTKTLLGNISAAGALTINSGVTLDATASNYNVSVGSNYTNNGTFLVNQNTVSFTGAVKNINSGGTGAGKRFYNVVVNCASNVNNTLTNAIEILNDLTINVGTLVTGANNITVGGNFQLTDNTNAGYTSSTSILTLNANSGTKDFNPGGNPLNIYRQINVNAPGAIYNVINNNFTISNNQPLNIQAGRFNLNGRNLTMTNGNVNISSGATFSIDAGSQLALANTASLNNNGGTLRIVGIASNRAMVVRNGATGGFTINQTVAGSTLEARFYTIQNSAGSGLTISDGTIHPTNNLSNGIFTGGASGAGTRYINFESLALPPLFTINNVEFYTGPANNVRKVGGDVVTFNGSTGNFAGPAFELDPGNVFINWIVTSKNWTGLALDNQWNTPNNWSPVGVPSITDTVYLDHSNVIPAYTVEIAGTNANCARLIIDRGVGTPIGLTVGTGRTLTVAENVNVNTGTTLTQTDNTSIVNIGGSYVNSGTLVNGNSTINFNGPAGDYLIIPGASNNFHNLTVNGAGEYMLGAAITVNNDLTISDGKLDVSASNFQITLGRNFLTSSPGIFTPRSGTFLLNGSNQNINGGPFFNFTSSGTGTKTISGSLTVQNDLTINSGTVVNAGAEVVFVGRNWINNAVGGFVQTGLGTVQFNGTTTQSIDNGSQTTTFNNIILLNAGAKNILKSFSVNGDFTIASGSGTVDFSTFAVTGTASKAFTLNGAATMILRGATNFPSGFGSVTLVSNSTVRYQADVTQIIFPTIYGNLDLRRETAVNNTKGMIGNITINGNLIINDVNTQLNANGDTIVLSGAFTFPAGGRRILWGTTGGFVHNGAGFTFPVNYSNFISSPDPGPEFNHVLLTGTATKSLTANLNIQGNFIVQNVITLAMGTFTITGQPSRTFSLQGGSTLSSAIPTATGVAFPTGFTNYSLSNISTVNLVGGTNPQTISVAPVYGNLNLNNTATSTISNASDTLFVAGNFNTNTSTLLDNGRHMKFTGATVDLRLYTPTAGTSIVLAGGAQNIVDGSGANPLDLENVRFINLGTKTIASNQNNTVNINGNVFIAAGVEVTCTNRSINFGGTTWTNNGAFRHLRTGGADRTFTFLGTNTQTVNVGLDNVYEHLVVFNKTSNPVNFVSNGAFFNRNEGVTPVFTINAGTTVNMGTLTHQIRGTVNNLGTWNTTTTNLTFAGGTQVITTPTFTANNILITGTGTKTMGCPWSINNLTINSGTVLNTSATGHNITLTGNWTNNGTFTVNTSTVFFESDNTSPRTITAGLSSFRDVFFNNSLTNARTYTLLSSSTTFTRQLNLGNGATLDINGNTLILGSTNSLSEVHTVQAGASLLVSSNSNLRFNNADGNSTLNVAGNLTVVGNNIFPARVNRATGAGRYNINITGTVSARYYAFDFLSDAGLNVAASATVHPTDNFSDGTFTNMNTAGGPPKYYLILNGVVTNPISNVTFNFAGTPTIGVHFNVQRTVAPFVQFNEVIAGAMGSFQYESDDNSATTGLLRWPVTLDITWTGAINRNWHIAGNWSPASVPTSVDNAIIPLVTNNPLITANNAICKNLTITTGNLGIENGFNLNVERDVIIGTGTSNGILNVISSTSNINVKGNWTRGSSGLFIAGGGTVNFTGVSGTFTITPNISAFANLNINGSNSTFFLNGAAMNVTNAFNIVDGTFTPNTAGYTITVGGNHNNTGVFNTGVSGTVSFNGSGPQSITNGTFVNVIFTNASTKTIFNNLLVNGTTVVSAGATLASDASGLMDFRGNVTFNSGTFFNDGGNMHLFYGTIWTGNNTNIVNTGGIRFIRSGAQSVAGARLNNIDFEGTGTKTLTGNVFVDGSVTLKTGTGLLNLQTFTINSTNGLGVFTLEPNTDLYIRGAANYPDNYLGYEFDITSITRYDAAMDQSVGGINYGNLILTTATTKTMMGNVGVKRNITFNNSTLDVSTNNYTLIVGGDYNNNSTGSFICRQGEVIFNGTGTTQFVYNGGVGTKTFNDLTLNRSTGFNVQLNNGSPITINGDLRVNSGNLDINGQTVNVGGNFIVSPSGSILTSGTFTLNNSLSSSLQIQLSGSTINNININAPGATYTLLDEFRTNGNFQLIAGTFNGNGFAANLGNGSEAVNVNAGATYTIGSGGRMALGNNVTCTIDGTLNAVGTPSNSAVISNNTSGGRYAFAVNGTIAAQYYLFEFMNISGIRINGGATVDPSNTFSNGTFTNGITGGTYLKIENNQTFTANNVNFATNPGGSSKNVAKTISTSGVVTFNDFTGVFGGPSFEQDPFNLIDWVGPVVLTWNGSVNTDWFNANNWTPSSGPVIAPNASTDVVVTTAINQPVITLDGAACNKLTINTGATLTVATPLVAAPDFTINSDVVLNGVFISSGTADTINVAGNWSKAPLGNFIPGNSTVIFNAPNNTKTINNGTSLFNNLEINGTALFQLGANTTVSGDLRVLQGTFDVSNANYSLTVRGNWLNNADFIPRTGLVTLLASSATPRTINNGSSNFNNLTITTSFGTTYTLVSNNLRVNGNTVVNSGTLNINNLEHFNGDNSGFDALTVFGNYTLGSSGTLRNGNNASVVINSAGNFFAVGTSDVVVTTVTRQSTGSYSFVVNNGGTIHARFYQFSFMNNAGIILQPGSFINSTNNFSDGSFTNGFAGGRYLDLQNDFSDFTASNVTFNVGPTRNVRRISGTGVITFLDAQGLLAGEDYEEDDGGAGTGLVRWTFTDPVYTWTGAISTDWHVGGNWNDEFAVPALAPPTISTIARIPDVSGGSGNFPLISAADAFCSELQIKPLAFLTIGSNRTLTIDGSVTNNAGTITSQVGSNSNINVGNLWANSGTFVANSSTVTMTAASGFKALTPGGSAFNNLSLTGGATFQTTSSVTLNGTLFLSTSTLQIMNSAHQLTVGGDWNNNGTFINGNGTVLFNKASGVQTVTNPVGEIFHNVSISNSGPVLKTVVFANNVNFINGNLNVNSVLSRLDGGSNNITIRGNWTNSGQPFLSTGTVIFNGVSTQTVQRISATPETFNNVTVDNSSNVSLLSNANLSGNLTLTTGTLISTNKILNVAGTLNGAGTLSFTTGTINLGGQNLHTGSFVKGTSLFNYNGSGAQTIRAIDYHNLTSSSTGPRTLAGSGTIRVSGVFTPGTNIYTITGSTVEFNGNTAQTIPVFNYFNLASTNIGNRVLGNPGTIGVAGNFNSGTNTYSVSASTMDFNGTGSQTTTAFTFNNFIKSNSSSLTLLGNINVNRNLNITGGTLNSDQFQITGNNSFPMTMATGTTLTLGSLSSVNNVLFPTNFIASNITLDCNSTVIYQSNGDQTVSTVPTYGNLSINSVASVNKNFTGTLNICSNLNSPSGAVTLQAGGNTINLSGNYTGLGNITFANGIFNIAGNWTNTGTFTAGTGLVNYNGSGAQTIGAATYYDLTSSNTGARTLASSGTIFVGNVFTPGTNSYTVTGSTVEFNGASTQTIPAFGYNNLRSSGAGNRTLSPTGIVGVRGNFVVGPNTWTTTSSTMEFNGSGAQSIDGAFTFDSLNVAKSGGSVTINSALNLIGTMRITGGDFNTTGGSLTFVSTAARTARLAPVTSGGITGNITMQRHAPAGLTGWSLVGTPVSGATIADWTSPWPTSGFPTSGFTGSTGSAGGPFISIYWYDETVPGLTDAGYQPATNITNSLINARGYWVYLGTGPVTTAAINFQTTGTPFIGTKDYGLTHTTSFAGPNHDGWNLVANPYPSTIDWLAPSGWFRSDLFNAYYVYNADAGQMASFIGGVGTFSLTRFIPSSQGFLVKSNGTNPQMISSESVKSRQNPSFMRSDENSNTSSTDESLVRMTLTKIGSVKYDESVIRFNSNANGQGFDANLDAPKYYPFETNSVAVGIIKANEHFAISSFNTLNAETQIPLVVKVQPNGTYNLHFDGIAQLINNYPEPFFADYLVIEDNSTGEIFNITNNANYSFVTSANDSVKNFTLRFSNPVITNVQNVKSNYEVTIATDQNGAFVLFNLAENEQVSINVYNTLGQNVTENENLSIKNGKYYLKNTGKLSEGIYLVNVKFDNKMYTSKIKF